MTCIPIYLIPIYLPNAILNLFQIPSISSSLVLNLPHPRAPETPSTPNTLLQLLDLHDLRGIDPLQHKLRHAVALLDCEIDVRVVEQQHLDLAAVVGVNHAGAGVDEVLGGEAGAGGYAAVCRLIGLG